MRDRLGQVEPAASAPERITSVWALPPRSKEIASRTMDFPAPVSPERTFKPFSKGISAFSMRAKFLILIA
jgi:hypothetical protein